MNDSERTETKWPGVDKLAEDIWSSTWDEKSIMKIQLRRALEPLLEAAEAVANRQRGASAPKRIY
jgi:hypothetical protein